MRLFVAVELPPEVRRLLAQAGRDLATRLGRFGRDLKLVAEQHLHVTIKFLGETDPAWLPRIEGALAAAARASTPLELKLSALGAFPHPGRPRVIWAGIEEPGPWLALAGRVERALTELGLPAEARPFAPHITLARARDRARLPAIDQALAAMAITRPASVLSALTLLESRLSPAGPDYTVARRFTLGIPP